MSTDTAGLGPLTTTTTQVHRIYIKASAEAIWNAITTPEWSQRYGYGGYVHYDLKPGGAFVVNPAEEMIEASKAMGFEIPDVIIDGEVLECDPPYRLVQTWRMLMDPNAAAEGFTQADLRDQGARDRRLPTHDPPRARERPAARAARGRRVRGRRRRRRLPVGPVGPQVAARDRRRPQRLTAEPRLGYARTAPRSTRGAVRLYRGPVRLYPGRGSAVPEGPVRLYLRPVRFGWGRAEARRRTISVRRSGEVATLRRRWPVRPGWKSWPGASRTRPFCRARSAGSSTP